MKTKKMYLFGLAVVMAFVLVIPGESLRAQSIQELEKELQKIAQDLAERLQEAGAQWQQSLHLDKADGKDEPLSFMLQHNEGLELSAQQIKELKKLRSRFERESIRREADIKVAKMELNELLEGDSIDLEKAEGKVREVERLRADQKLSRIRTVEDAKALLHADQRKKLAVLQASNSSAN